MNEIDGNTVMCSKCNMYQTPNKCKKNLSAKLYLQSGEDYICLSAFGSILSDIAQCSAVDVTHDALLNSAPFTLKHINSIIQSVTC